MDNSPAIRSDDVVICFKEKRIRLLTSFTFSDLKKLVKTLSAAYGWVEDEVIIDTPVFFARM